MDLTVDYQYREIQKGDKCYCMPTDCQEGSRRWNFWIYWQDLGLPVPECKPRRVLISRTNASMA